jgi:hypothetical protein
MPAVCTLNGIEPQPIAYDPNAIGALFKSSISSPIELQPGAHTLSTHGIVADYTRYATNAGRLHAYSYGAVADCPLSATRQMLVGHTAISMGGN